MGRAALAEAVDILVLMLSPIVPHMSQELWTRLGHTGLILDARWPVWSEALCEEQDIEIPIMVNGKLRAKLHVAKGTDRASLQGLAVGHERIAAFTEGKTVRKVIVVPDKLVNIVVS